MCASNQSPAEIFREYSFSIIHSGICKNYFVRAHNVNLHTHNYRYTHIYIYIGKEEFLKRHFILSKNLVFFFSVLKVLLRRNRLLVALNWFEYQQSISCKNVDDTILSSEFVAYLQMSLSESLWYNLSTYWCGQLNTHINTCELRSPT